MLRTHVSLSAMFLVVTAACGGATFPEVPEDPAPPGHPGNPASGDPTAPGTSPAERDRGAPSTGPSAVDASVVSVHIERALLGKAACDREYLGVDYVRATRQMRWLPTCVPVDGAAVGPGLPIKERVLDPNEAQRVEDALATITYSTAPPCGGRDGYEHSMTTRTASGAVERYSARNTACNGDRLAPKIVEVYEVFASLRR